MSEQDDGEVVDGEGGEEINVRAFGFFGCFIAFLSSDLCAVLSASRE